MRNTYQGISVIFVRGFSCFKNLLLVLSFVSCGGSFSGNTCAGTGDFFRGAGGFFRCLFQTGGKAFGSVFQFVEGEAALYS